MNGSGDDLVFGEHDLDAWAAHQCTHLQADAKRASPLAAGLLEAAGVTSAALLALSERVIRDPDWRSGFLNPCTIVVRDAEHPAGRLGAWEENGALCVEAELGEGTILVVRGARAELRVGRRSQKSSKGIGRAQPRSLAEDPSQPCVAGAVLRFATGTRPYDLTPTGAGRAGRRARGPPAASGGPAR